MENEFRLSEIFPLPWSVCFKIIIFLYLFCKLYQFGTEKVILNFKNNRFEK